MIYQITEEQRQQLLNALKTRDLRLHDDCFWMLLALTPVDDHIGSVNKMVDEEEPVAYLAWRDGKPCYEGSDAVCLDAIWPVGADDDRTSMPVYTHPAPLRELSDAEIDVVTAAFWGGSFSADAQRAFARAVLRAAR